MSKGLGKVEQHILLFSYRQKDGKNYFHSRSGALQAYYQNKYHVKYHSRKVVRKVIPVKIYNSLQTIFTNALKRLEKKGYIEIYRGRRRVIRESTFREAYEELGEEAVTNYLDMTPEKKDQLQDWDNSNCFVENWRGWYRTSYRLTEKGRKQAYKLFVKTIK